MLCSYFIFREEKDLIVALELAEKITKKKHAHVTGVQANPTTSRPGILKKPCQPESSRR